MRSRVGISSARLRVGRSEKLVLFFSFYISNGSLLKVELVIGIVKSLSRFNNTHSTIRKSVKLSVFDSTDFMHVLGQLRERRW